MIGVLKEGTRALLYDVSLTWLRLNERRSSLHEWSKVNDTAAREQTFAAAMTQFEEQFAAATAVTAVTRPLNLYYGLVQAGMAIAAAHAPDPWGFSRHGLRLGDRNLELADMMVGPESGGAFQTVAAAIGSPGITEPVTLGALWASLPDLTEIGILPGSMWPEPLIVLVDERPSRWPRAVFLLPGEMPSGVRAFIARFGAIMASYPGAAGVAIPMARDSIRPPVYPGGNWHVTVRWPGADPQQEMSEEELRAFFDKVAPEYRYRGERFLRPAIDASMTAPPSPLMTWWLLLYSFSALARYEPSLWTKLLDLDSSKVAVFLRYALDEALTAVPQLVLEAFDGKPTLLAKPIAF